MSPLRALRAEPTPERPGPGPLPDSLLRALDVSIGRKMQGLLAGDYRSALLGDGTELAQVRPYVPGDDDVSAGFVPSGDRILARDPQGPAGRRHERT